MPVQVFVDESDGGSPSPKRHFVMAGLLSTSEDWADFSTEWQDVLDVRAPFVEVFKMKDAAGLTGKFHGWSEERRDDLLRRLARIVNRRVKLAFSSTIDLDAHAKYWANLRKPMNQTYFWPFQTIILAVCNELQDLGWQERFEIIFDENKIFGENARRCYPIIRETVRVQRPEAYHLMPIDPLFRKDDEFLPLQAADLFAWCWRHNSNNPTAPKFNWLLDELKDVSGSEYSAYYDEERIRSVHKQSLCVKPLPDMQELFNGLFPNRRRQ